MGASCVLVRFHWQSEMFAFDGGNHNEPPGACVAAWVSEGSALLCQV